jgi:hypothetical protein
MNTMVVERGNEIASAFRQTGSVLGVALSGSLLASLGATAACA